MTCFEVGFVAPCVKQAWGPFFPSRPQQRLSFTECTVSSSHSLRLLGSYPNKSCLTNSGQGQFSPEIRFSFLRIASFKVLGRARWSQPSLEQPDARPMHPEFLSSPATLSLGGCQGCQEKVFQSATLMVLPRGEEVVGRDRGEDTGVAGDLAHHLP